MSPRYGMIAQALSKSAVFFQPADIVNQVLNFGQPAPIDIRISGRRARTPTRWRKVVRDERDPGRRGRARVSGPRRSALTIDVDRTLAQQFV